MGIRGNAPKTSQGARAVKSGGAGWRLRCSNAPALPVRLRQRWQDLSLKDGGDPGLHIQTGDADSATCCFGDGGAEEFPHSRPIHQQLFRLDEKWSSCQGSIALMTLPMMLERPLMSKHD